MLKINQWHEIRKKYQAESIAVVGNGPSALRYSIGNRIDACDLVVRMNNYKITAGFAPFIGVKIDVFLSSLFFRIVQKTEKDLRREGVRMIWSSIPDMPYVDQWPIDVARAKDNFPAYDIYLPSRYDFIKAVDKPDWHIFARYAGYALMGQKFLEAFGIWWPVPSSGLMAILMAMNCRPKSMIITGFDFYAADKKAHYYEENGIIPKKTHHSFASEPAVLCKYIKKNRSIKFILALDPATKGLEPLSKMDNVEFIRRQLAGRESKVNIDA